MRKFLITIAFLLLLAIAIGSVWIFAGKKISGFLDRFGTIETNSERITSVRYEGSGSGGILHLNGLGLDLAPAVERGAQPSVGSTKEGDIALAYEGNVFAFGPLPKTADDSTDVLAAAPQVGDEAVISTRHSFLSWPTFFDLNFMTGQSPTWKRHFYYQLTWKRSTGANLKMAWRYEQYFYSGNGWTGGTMTRAGETGLMQVEIHH